jgi:hemoglobin-like flavoprotein
MSFDPIPALAANKDRRPAPVSFAQSHYDFAARLSRHEWHLMMDRWERLQPYADRFATTFFDTLFAWEPDFRQFFGGASLEAQFLRFAHLLTQIVSAEDDREELDYRTEEIVRRYARDDSETERSYALRAAIAALLGDVAAAQMTPHMRASWKAAYAAVATILRGTTWLARGATIMDSAMRAELASDRHSPAIQRAMESEADAEAA